MDKRFVPQDESELKLMFGPLGHQCHEDENPSPSVDELPGLFQALHPKVKELYLESRGDLQLDQLRTEMTKLVNEFYEYDKMLQAARDTIAEAETSKRRKTSKPAASKRPALIEAFKKVYGGADEVKKAFEVNGEGFEKLLDEYDTCFKARGAASDSSHENPASDSEPAEASRSGSQKPAEASRSQ